jgi:hypothetical protein
MRTLSRKFALIGVLVLGCKQAPEQGVSRAAGSEPSLHTMLLSDLRLKSGANKTLTGRFDSTAVVWREEQSQVVPRLHYVWAVYRPPKVTHASYEVVGGERDSSYAILSDPASWYHLTGTWTPATSAEAERACVELARTASPLAPTGQIAIPFDDARQEVRSMPQHLRNLAASINKDPASIKPPTDSTPFWIAEVWMFEAAGSTKYRCRFPLRRQQARGEFTLDKIRTVEGVGWYVPLSLPSDTG